MRHPSGSTAPITVRPALFAPAAISRPAPTAAPDLDTAVARWQALTPFTPQPCGTPWCADCWDVDLGRFHHSVQAITHYEAVDGVDEHGEIRVTVEHLDAEDDAERGDTNTEVYLNYAMRGVVLTPARARSVATALRKAVAGTDALLRRAPQDGTTGAVSIVRLCEKDLQIGAVVVGDPDDQPVTVFINYVETSTAGDVRKACGETTHYWTNTSVDLPRTEAGELATALEAAADLCAADRALADRAVVAA